jgi:hypothetical protein
VQRLKAEIAEREASVRTLVGDRASGPDAAWPDLLKIRDWALKWRAGMASRKLPESLGAWVVGAWDRKAVGGLHAAASKAAATWRAAAGNVRAALAIPAEGRQDLERLPFGAAGDKAETWRKNLDKLPSYIAYWRLHQTVVRRGLSELAAMGHEGRCEPARLPLVLEQTWARTLIDRALRERPSCASSTPSPTSS